MEVDVIDVEEESSVKKTWVSPTLTLLNEANINGGEGGGGETSGLWQHS